MFSFFLGSKYIFFSLAFSYIFITKSYVRIALLIKLYIKHDLISFQTFMLQLNSNTSFGLQFLL